MIKPFTALLFLVSMASAEPCQVSRAELNVYAALPDASSVDPSIVESSPDPIPNSSFQIGWHQLQDVVSMLRPRLLATPTNITPIFPSPPGDFVSISPSTQDELMRDYAIKLHQLCTIPRIRIGSMRVLRRRDIRAFGEEHGKHTPSEFWNRFHSEFGSTASLCFLSRVAFDRKMRFAVVHVSAGVSTMGGSGILYVFQNSDSGWSVIHAYPTWTT